jgi:hypothetical protein
MKIWRTGTSLDVILLRYEDLYVIQHSKTDILAKPGLVTCSAAKE